jgi:hypothetical protein
MTKKETLQQDVENFVEVYGERYKQLETDLIANAEHVAAKYQLLGERYIELANKVRQQGKETATHHIHALIEALLSRCC